MTVAMSYRLGEPRRNIKPCAKRLTAAHYHKVTGCCDNGDDGHNDVYNCPFIRRMIVNEATESGTFVEVFNEDDSIVETEDEIGNSPSAGSKTEGRTILVTNEELPKESGGDEKEKERQEKKANTEDEVENFSAGVSRKNSGSDGVTRVEDGSLSAEMEAQGKAMPVRKVEAVNLLDEVSKEISDGVTEKGKNEEQWKEESVKKTVKRTIVDQTTESDTMTDEKDKSQSEVPVCVERVVCGKLHENGNEHRYQKSSMPFPGNPQEATRGEVNTYFLPPGTNGMETNRHSVTTPQTRERVTIKMAFSNFTFTQLIHFLPALLVLNLGNCGVSGIPYCPAKQSAELGSIGTLYCKFPDNFDAVYWYDESTLDGPPLVAYYRNSQMKRGPGFRNNAYDISENGSLVISNVSLVHEKVYLFVLSTGQDTYERNSVSLKVVVYPGHDSPRIKCDKCSGNYYHFDDGRNTITCVSDKSRPPVNLEWINRTTNGDFPVEDQTNKIADNKDGTYNSSTILHLTKNGNSQMATFVCRGRWYSESWRQETEVLIYYGPVSVQPSALFIWPRSCKYSATQSCEVKEEDTHQIPFALQSWHRNVSVKWTTTRPDLISFSSYELSVTEQGYSSFDIVCSATYKVSEDLVCEEELWIEIHVYDPVLNINASASVRIIPKSCRPRNRKAVKFAIAGLAVIIGVVVAIPLFIYFKRKTIIQCSGNGNRGQRVKEEEQQL